MIQKTLKVESPVSLTVRPKITEELTSPKFEFLLDRLKVREFEYEKLEDSIKRNKVSARDWDYQQYNTPFKYDTFDKSEASQKLYDKIRDMKRTKQTEDSVFYKGINLKEFQFEIKNTDNISPQFFRKLRNRGKSLLTLSILIYTHRCYKE